MYKEELLRSRAPKLISYLALLPLSWLLFALPVFAQTHEIAPMAGFQTGGAIELNGENTALESAAAYGVTVSFDRKPGRKVDLTVMHQEARAELRDPFEPVLSADVSVTYFQLGGRYVFHPDERVRPYLAMTLGGTWLAVNGDGALNGSWAIAGGADVQLTSSVALRFDGRLHITLLGSGTEIGCDSSGVCSSTSSGGSFSQFAATTGLVFRF